MRARSSDGYGWVSAACSRGEGSNEASAASMPSALVPEISPRYNSVRSGCTTRSIESIEVGFAVARGAGQRAVVVHHLDARQQRRILRAELRHQLARQRLRLGPRHRQRTALPVIPPELVVQVRAGGHPGHADVTDDLALAHVFSHAFVGSEARHVAISRADVLVVLDDHEVAVAVFLATKLDHSIAGRIDRRAHR